MGAFDFSGNSFADPRAMALLGLSQGLLSASAPSSVPVGIGAAMGQGIGGALNGAMGAQRYNLAQQQVDAMRMQNDMLRGKYNFLFGGSLPAEPSASAGGTQEMPVPVPSLGMQTSMPVSAAGGGTAPVPGYTPRFPVLPGFESNPRMSDAAWMGFVPQGPVSALAAAASKNPIQVDRGPMVELRDTRDPTKVLATVPKSGAPAAVPYAESDLTPAQAREQELALRRASATQIQNNVNSFMPASEAAQKDFMDKTAKNYDALRTAPVLVNNIAKARELATSGNPFIGSFGTQKAAIAQFFNNNLGTSIAPDSIASAGELKNRLFQQIMDNLKKMDAQPSEMQQKMMMEALGNLNTDPGALDKVLGVTDEIVRGKVALHNQEVESAQKRGVKFPYDPIIKMPSLPGKVPSQAAINRLKMNPKERSQFEAVFGPGSADQYLGK